MKQVLILNYHVLETADRKLISPLEELYSMKMEKFRQQMEMLRMTDVPLVSLSDMISKGPDADFSVAVTFDDGNSTDHPDAMPVLKQYRIPATFFISLHNVKRGHISWQQIREMAAEGFELGSHGITHKDLSRMTYEQAIEEMRSSKQSIEQQTSCEVPYFAPAFGMYSRRLPAAAAALGYKAFFNASFRINSLKPDQFIFHRWSVKPATSMEDFEQIISFNKKRIAGKTLLSNGKRQLIYIFGTDIVNKLNTLLHKNKSL